MEREDTRINRPETKAQMPATDLNSPLDLRMLNNGIAEREFAERAPTNQHRLRSELKTRTNCCLRLPTEDWSASAGGADTS
jgi:hypothetical protein